MGRFALLLCAASLAAACSGGGAPATEDGAGPGAGEAAAPAVRAEADEPRNAAETAAETARAVRSEASAGGAPGGAVETARRCGWLHNPTPGNWWLVDRHGEWVLATQGSDGAPGMEDLPDMTEAGWERTNGNYGYGCACMTLTVVTATRKVVRLASADAKPLQQCRSDPRLPSP